MDKTVRVGLARGLNSYSWTGSWIQQLQEDWLVDKTVTVRLARGYNSYSEWLVDKTVTVGLACGYNSYLQIGSWIH